MCMCVCVCTHCIARFCGCFCLSTFPVAPLRLHQLMFVTIATYIAAFIHFIKNTKDIILL